MQRLNGARPPEALKLGMIITALAMEWRLRRAPGYRLLRDAMLWLRAPAALRPSWREW